jgi:hypothetical protein
VPTQTMPGWLQVFAEHHHHRRRQRPARAHSRPRGHYRQAAPLPAKHCSRSHGPSASSRSPQSSPYARTGALATDVRLKRAHRILGSAWHGMAAHARPSYAESRGVEACRAQIPPLSSLWAEGVDSCHGLVDASLGEAA